MNVSIPTQFLNTNPNSKATFRPGGDAAYVSYLLGGIINEIADFSTDRLTAGEDFSAYIRRIATDVVSPELAFSPALRAKFDRAAERIIEKELDRQTKADVRAAKKAAKASKGEAVITTTEAEPVKVGRWTYPTRLVTISDSNEFYHERNTKRDGSGEWVEFSRNGIPA